MHTLLKETPGSFWDPRCHKTSELCEFDNRYTSHGGSLGLFQVSKSKGTVHGCTTKSRKIHTHCRFIKSSTSFQPHIHPSFYLLI